MPKKPHVPGAPGDDYDPALLRELRALRYKYHYDERVLGYINQETGNCPECGLTSGFVNVVRAQWLFCLRDKTKWFVGLVPADQRLHETEADLRANVEFLSRFKVVRPTYEAYFEPLIPEPSTDSSSPSPHELSKKERTKELSPEDIDKHAGRIKQDAEQKRLGYKHHLDALERDRKKQEYLEKKTQEEKNAEYERERDRRGEDFEPDL